MAISKRILVAMVFFSLLVVHLVEADNQVVVNKDATKSSYTPKLDCGAACEARCRLASRQKICKRACGTCCARCNCAPPGTSGNQELCPCYFAMTTHGGKRKCP
ncbi:gibberellin-regulated protein 1-like isoform X1 [Nicotiana sylvestris]|uniref:Gibberellin-regulated protein 1-like isoform X1 n=1 Tax=Nicotiana sylvestris TaxID=4096 RepID=A0A1U7W503_NICSY|nr:PREDICTED: gibberellin-regulated protein 1-like isoform X1 [Nicotiana sylvestris]